MKPIRFVPSHINQLREDLEGALLSLETVEFAGVKIVPQEEFKGEECSFLVVAGGPRPGLVGQEISVFLQVSDEWKERDIRVTVLYGRTELKTPGGE